MCSLIVLISEYLCLILKETIMYNDNILSNVLTSVFPAGYDVNLVEEGQVDFDNAVFLFLSTNNFGGCTGNCGSGNKIPEPLSASQTNDLHIIWVCRWLLVAGLTSMTDQSPIFT